MAQQLNGNSSVEAQYILTPEDLREELDNMVELLSLNPRNNQNLCFMGGMHEILFLIFLYEDENDEEQSVRIAACRVFSLIVANNPDV